MRGRNIIEKGIAYHLLYGMKVCAANLRCGKCKFPALDFEKGDLAHRKNMAVIDTECFCQISLIAAGINYLSFHGTY
jgi:hypothetical protein